MSNKTSLEIRLKRASELAGQQIESGLIQGCVFAIGDEGPAIACGLQKIHPAEVPMSPDSRFDMASVGKVFTAACCACLAADGKLDVDAPFTRYLPEHELGAQCDITVRDLALHVSGFSNEKPYEVPDIVQFERELWKKMPVRRRLEGFEYCCYNFILLGKIVERVSGMTLEEFARKSIWNPLGMSHTQWTAPGDGPNEVEHWFPNRPAGTHNDTTTFYCPYPLGNGSCFSTADDMRRFTQAIAEQRFFPKACLDLLLTPGYEQSGTRRSFGWDMTEFNLFVPPENTPFRCSSAGIPACFSKKTIHHTGWTGQSIYVDPENRASAVVLTSRTGDHLEARRGRNAIAAVLLDR